MKCNVCGKEAPNIIHRNARGNGTPWPVEWCPFCADEEIKRDRADNWPDFSSFIGTMEEEG